MKLSPSLFAVLAAASMLVVTGCPRPQQTPPPLPQQPAGTPYNTVQIGDPFIASNVLVESSGGKRSQTGTLEIFAILRNKSPQPLAFEARARFFDEAGAPLDEDTVFERVSISPRASGTYRARSMSPEARQYIVEVRAAQ